MKKYALKFVHLVLASQARAVVSKHNPFVIGVTGSVGKSSTKEAIFQVLHDRFGDDVRKSHGNFNSEIGLPISILGYGEKNFQMQIWRWPFFLVRSYFKIFEKKYPKYLVLELGVDKPGDIAYLGQIVKFDIAVITSTDGAHLANFKTKKDYEDEKISILKEVKEGGVAIVNFDDKALRDISFPQVIHYSTSDRHADLYAETIKPSLSGTEYRICGEGQKIAIRSELLGSQFVSSSLAAFAVGQQFGIQSLQIKKSLEKLQPINGRMRILKGRDDRTIIDDTYNANPASVIAALDVLGQIEYPGRKVAILGNMNELGASEVELHKQVGEYSRGKADLCVFVGKNAGIMAKANGDSGQVEVFENRRDLEKVLDKLIKPRDLVLVKASQNNNYFEEVTKKLMLEPEKAPELLVRQGKNWLKKK